LASSPQLIESTFSHHVLLKLTAFQYYQPSSVLVSFTYSLICFLILSTQ
jgi:hypothetical protein